jgi:hypothetical protein
LLHLYNYKIPLGPPLKKGEELMENDPILEKKDYGKINPFKIWEELESNEHI